MLNEFGKSAPAQRHRRALRHGWELRHRRAPGLAVAVTALAAALPRAQSDAPAGVGPEVRSAVGRGLQYLALSQNSDGSWRANGGQGGYPVAMTALAGTAMLASGSTPTRGRYWLQVRRATDFLLSCAQPDGLVAVSREVSQPMFGHGFATLFLAEVYGMEEDRGRQRILHDVLERACELTARSQSRAGGWLYTPDSNSDEGSVTITQIQALRACRNAGIAISEDTAARAVDYVRNSANPDGSIRYRVSSVGDSR